jgi:DNA polymerase III subunit beta
MTAATATKTKASSTTLTIPRTELLHAVQAASKAIQSRSPKPILQNVLIGNGLITGTDLDLRIDVAIGEHCEPFLVPADRLLAILRTASNDSVTLSTTASAVKVKCGRGSWTLPTEDASEFPAWEPEKLKALCRLPADQFARAARATVYATDTESSRFALGGVLLDVTDGNPTWIGTDGRRMAIVETETDQAVDDSATIIPSRTIGVVAGMASGDGSVQIEANSAEIKFSMDGITVTGRLLEGRFPRWRDVVGEQDIEPNVLEVHELLQAVRAASIVTSEQSKGIDVEFAGETVTLTGQSSEYGQSRVALSSVSPGLAAKTKVDPRFLADYLKNLPDDEEPHVAIYAKDKESAVVLKCSDYTGVIMPLAGDA